MSTFVDSNVFIRLFVEDDDIKELRVGQAYVKRHTSKRVDVRRIWVRRPMFKFSDNS